MPVCYWVLLEPELLFHAFKCIHFIEASRCHPIDSRFDREMSGKETFTEEEKHGFKLFKTE